MRSRTALYAAVILMASSLGLGLSALSGHRAVAGLDITGEWDVSYSLTCTAAFEQSGSDLSAQVDCGGGLEGALEGTVDWSAGSFTLTGSLSLVQVEIEGVLPDDDTLAGTFSAPPIAPSGTFTGNRNDGAPNGADLTGDWLLTIEEIFAGSCVVAIEHSGASVSARMDCEPARTGALDGTFDIATSNIHLSGQFSTFTQLVLDGTVSADGSLIDGTWMVDPGGISGTFIAARRSAASPSPTLAASASETPTSTPTPAVPAELPPSGSGSGPSGRAIALDWIIAALAGVTALGGAAWYARRQWLVP